MFATLLFATAVPIVRFVFAVILPLVVIAPLELIAATVLVPLTVKLVNVPTLVMLLCA